MADLEKKSPDDAGQRTASGPSPEDLRRSVVEKYTEVAQSPGKGFAFPTGPESASQLGYSAEFMERVPGPIRESFCGVGNPLSLGPIEEGEVVADIGCGAGFDAFIAAQCVGPTGKVVGLDMTGAMLEKAKEARDGLGWRHVELHEGDAEDLPLDDASVDVLISNGVFNLCPDKEQVFREAYRVLKPGGRLMVADMILERDLPPEVLDNPKAWADWIGGALPGTEFLAHLKAAGFEEAEIVRTTGYKTSRFTIGAEIRALKPLS